MNKRQEIKSIENESEINEMGRAKAGLKILMKAHSDKPYGHFYYRRDHSDPCCPSSKCICLYLVCISIYIS